MNDNAFLTFVYMRYGDNHDPIYRGVGGAIWSAVSRVVLGGETRRTCSRWLMLFVENDRDCASTALKSSRRSDSYRMGPRVRNNPVRVLSLIFFRDAA